MYIYRCKSSQDNVAVVKFNTLTFESSLLLLASSTPHSGSNTAFNEFISLLISLLGAVNA